MSLLNYNAKEIHCKIIYYGPASSGKTTNIQWIAKNTESQNKLDVSSIPLQTNPSTFFDFLPLDIGTIRGFNARLHLYTIPSGHSLFETSQKLLIKGMDGIIFIADSQKNKSESNKKSLHELSEHLKEEGLEISKVPMTIQYNKRDLSDIQTVPQMRTELNLYNHPDFPCSAKTGKGVFESLKTLSKMILTVLKGGSLQ